MRYILRILAYRCFDALLYVFKVPFFERLMAIAAVKTAASIPETRRIEQRYMQQTRELLVNLVRQAHAGERFRSPLTISVGADMRQKLCYPFTPQQVEQIRLSKAPAQKKQFSYELIKWQLDEQELRGVVAMNIQYQNEALGMDFSFADLRLSIHCRKTGIAGLQVVAAEPVQPERTEA